MAAGLPGNLIGGQTMTKMVKKTVLDNEWIDLMKEAKTIGLSVDEIRLFLIQVQESD